MSWLATYCPRSNQTLHTAWGKTIFCNLVAVMRHASVIGARAVPLRQTCLLATRRVGGLYLLAGGQSGAVQARVHGQELDVEEGLDGRACVTLRTKCAQNRTQFQCGSCCTSMPVQWEAKLK